jgi:serine/threonine-protein kinase
MSAAPTTKLPEVGDIIGDRYVVQRLLARGGMGAVYVAQHNATDAVVALKVLLDTSGEDTTTRARFVREAKVAAALGHPGIVKIFDAGVDLRTGPYLAMELLEGDSLDSVVANDNPPLDLRLGYVREMLEALAVAHAAGVVHRDIKPENLFLANDGEGGVRVKLLDFGIARVQQATTQTVDGTALGTIYYMAPEQMMDARRASAAADVWSVGVMMYELVCGQLPFEGTTIHEVAVKVCTATPQPLTERAHFLDPELGALVMQCLDKDPKRRPQNAAELAQRLDALGVVSARGSRSSLTPLRTLPAQIAPAQHVHSATIASSPTQGDEMQLGISQALVPSAAPPRTTLTPSGAATVVAVRTDSAKKGVVAPVLAAAAALALAVAAFAGRDRINASRDARPTAARSATQRIESGSGAVPSSTATANLPVQTASPTALAVTDAATQSQAVAAASAQVPSAVGSRNARTVRPASPGTTAIASANQASTNATASQPAPTVAAPSPSQPQPTAAPVQPAVVPTPTVAAQNAATNSPSPAPVIRPVQPAIAATPHPQHHTPTPTEPEAPVSF